MDSSRGESMGRCGINGGFQPQEVDVRAEIREQ